MHPDSIPEYDSSSSSCSGDPPACSPDSLCSASSMDSSKDAETGTPPPDLFVPTVTAISTSPDLKWMVQPTIITSVSPSLGRAEPTRASGPVHSPPPAGANKSSNRKGQKDQPSKEEDDRKRVRRERNKIAAAKCRNRRRELTDTLQAETDTLEEDKAALQTEIAELLTEKERLEQILASHEPNCKRPNNDDGGGEEEEYVDVMLQDPPSSPQLLSMLEESGRLPESVIMATVESPIAPDTMDVTPCISAAAILGNSNILLCSSAEEDPLEDLKDDLDDLVPSLEMAVASEAAASVPDIDLSSGPFCLSDWETLYKSVANDLEPLSASAVSSSPTCSNYRSVFSFNYSELDSLAEACEGLTKGGLSAGSEFTKDSLNSPTLLAL